MSKIYLGIELGSTRIKAVGIDEKHLPVISGDYTWASTFENGVWTYPMEQVWEGLREAILELEEAENIACMGVSAMMHGYLAFDKDWNLLVPFRTWQNTMTGQAAAELTELFGFNIPQRWSIAHLYQAVLNGEEHIDKIAHITTLAGYVHYMLTGVNAIGIGEASGMFPIDSEKNCYDEETLKSLPGFPRSRQDHGRWSRYFPECFWQGTMQAALPRRARSFWGAYSARASPSPRLRETPAPA